MTETERCCICFDKIAESQYPYTCMHSIHINCAHAWNRPCPLCLADFKQEDLEIDKTNFMYVLGNTLNLPLNIENYKSQWDYNCCNHNFKNHRVIFHRSNVAPYGVIGSCACGSTQLFNWIC
jgi:hypothetical protein